MSRIKNESEKGEAQNLSLLSSNHAHILINCWTAQSTKSCHFSYVDTTIHKFGVMFHKNLRNVCFCAFVSADALSLSPYSAARYKR